MSPTSSLSPTKTPPWKQMSIHNSKNELTPLGFTRQRLVFDEDDGDDDNKENKNIQESKDLKSIGLKYD